MVKPMDKYSLVIGRFQPFHEGHKALIESLLAEGKRVCVAIMDTKQDEDNPLTVEDRRQRIQSTYAYVGPYYFRIEVIPPIAEVCYGRDVGYKLTRVHHDKEHIRATDIRNGTEPNGYTDAEFLKKYKEVCEKVHRLAKAQGLWPDGKTRRLSDPIALAHSELSEAYECGRVGNPPDKNIKDFTGLEVQLSDVLGILMDMEVGYGLRISEALGHKMKFNEGRGHLHGKMF